MLNHNKENFSTNSKEPRIYMYEAVSPGYQKMWVHSSSLRYIEARPWLLSLLSVSLLRPAYTRETIIHIPDSTCPLRIPTDIRQNTLLSEAMKNLVFYEATHAIVQKTNDTYYMFELSTEGEFKEEEIPFLGGNLFIILCLVLSCFLALYAVVGIFVFLIYAKYKLERYLQTYLEQNRRFQKAKKKVEANNNAHVRIASDKEKIIVEKYLRMHLFSTEVKDKIIDWKKLSDAKKLKKSQKKSNVSLSIFQAPVLYIDYVRRMRANSFEMFITHIIESSQHFTSLKLSNEKDFESVSARVDILHPKYLDFCTKQGLISLEISKQVELMKKYNLNIEWKSDSTTDAYVNIRWKTAGEKSADKQESNHEKGSSSNSNEFSDEDFTSVFLREECKQSSFSTDYILIRDLLAKYDQYCKEKKIDDLHKVNIVG